MVSGTDQATDLVATDVGVKANALRVAPANDITDGTYIGDIKFGEALPANTNTQEIVGDAAENAAAAGNPVLTGGRYDATPRTLGDGDVGAIALDADGAVQISDGGNTITVDGTVTANPASGTIDTVTTVAAVTDITNTVTVDLGANNDVTVTSGSITADLGANNDVTIDGSSIVSVDDTATHATGTTEGVNIMAAATPTDTNVDANDIGMVAMSVDRRLHVDAQIVGTDAALDCSGATVTVDGSGVTQPVSGTVTANLSATDNAVLDSIQTAVEVSDNSIVVDDAAFTPATTSVNMAGFEYDDTTPDSVDEGDAGAARISANRNQYVQIRDGAGAERGANVDASGYLEVNIKAGAGSGGTASTDDAAFTAGSGSGTPAMGFFSTDTVDAGDVGVLAMDASRRLMCSIEVDNVGIGGGTQYTEDAAAAANPVGNAVLLVREDARAGSLTSTDGDNVAQRGNNKGEAYVIDTDANALLTTIDADTSTIAGDTTSIDAKMVSGTVIGAVEISDTSFAVADGNALGEGVLIQGDDGTDRKNINVDATTGDVQVDVTNTVTVDLGVNNDVTIDTAAVTSLALIDNPIVAHDAVASGSTGVNMAGGLATNSVEGLTQVAAADASRVTTDLNGCVVTRNGTTLEELVSERVSDTAGTSTAMTGAFAAGGAGIHAYVTSVTVCNTHATTNGYVDLRDGAAGSVVWTFPLPATGGATHNFNPPLKFAANTAVAYDVSAAISTVYISVNGFFAQG